MKYKIKQCSYCKKLKPCKRRFCSHKCYWSWLKGKRMSPKTEFKKGSKLSDETKNKMKGRTPWNKGKPHLAVRGEKHPFWKGGVSNLRRRLYDCYKYVEWRSKVFERDNYICQICGERSTEGKRLILNAHHKKSMGTIIKENRLVALEQAEECNKLWDIDNGITWCYECHRKNDKNIGLNQYKLEPTPL